jgi:hypothetical protein
MPLYPTWRRDAVHTQETLLQAATSQIGLELPTEVALQRVTAPGQLLDESEVASLDHVVGQRPFRAVSGMLPLVSDAGRSYETDFPGRHFYGAVHLRAGIYRIASLSRSGRYR